LPGGFQGQQPLSAQDMSSALGVVAAREGILRVALPAGTPSVATFDRVLVDQLGLADLASSVQAEARRAGLAPPSRFGTEVVARQLGLRFNHPASDDALELYPTDPITRAEAAYSFAQILDNPGQADWARAELARFQLPSYTPRQRAALRLAISKIGMPYVSRGATDPT